MTEAMVDGDSGHMDRQDMAAILTALDGIAVSAEATRPHSPDDDAAPSRRAAPPPDRPRSRGVVVRSADRTGAKSWAAAPLQVRIRSAVPLAVLPDSAPSPTI
jgi:hypothetical protein